MVNSYSPTWFQLFLETRPFTAQETAFIGRNLPKPPYQKLLDLGCGQGRHSNPLAHIGYEILGIDLNEAALAAARSLAPASASYLRMNMADIDQLPKKFDAILSIWQSFGYFDEQGNLELLRKISQQLTPKGRLILDIYHRGFWEQHQGSRELERNGVTIKVLESLQGRRLTARLDYGKHGSDVFEWQLYLPEEIRDLAKTVGLSCLRMCTEYDENKPVTPEKPMMQLVFERQV